MIYLFLTNIFYYYWIKFWPQVNTRGPEILNYFLNSIGDWLPLVETLTWNQQLFLCLLNQVFDQKSIGTWGPWFSLISNSLKNIFCKNKVALKPQKYLIVPYNVEEHIYRERHKDLKNISIFLTLLIDLKIKLEDFFQVLWPSQIIWILEVNKYLGVLSWGRHRLLDNWRCGDKCCPKEITENTYLIISRCLFSYQFTACWE